MKLFVASVLCISVLGMSAFSFPYVYNGTLISNIAAALSVEAPTQIEEAPEIAARTTAPSDDLIPQADQFFAGNGTGLATSNWGASAAGPFTSSFTSGNVANFATVNGTGTGGSISVGGLNAIENFTLTSASGTISNLSNGVVPVTVASGKLLDFGTQSFTTSATAGYNLSGLGTFALAGGTYGGGFTINSGTIIARGVNAMGGGATNSLTINGGMIAANATRNLSNKYPNGIVFGGDFQIGALTGSVPLAVSGADLTFNNNVSLGPASRSITIGGDGVYTFSGIISGNAGSGLTIARLPGTSGAVVLSGANTYSGNTTVSNGGLSLAAGASIANSPVIEIGGGGVIDVSALITALTLASGQALRASGTTTTGTINTSSTKGLTTAANSPIQFSAFNGVNAPLTVALSGILALQSSNPVTVTVSNGGLPLGLGSYKLIAKSGTASVTGTPTAVTVNGDGVNGTPSLVLTSGELFLQVSAVNTPPEVPSSSVGGPVGTAFYDFDVDTVYSDIDGDSLASISNISVAGGPSGGSTVSVLAGNIIRFTPANPSLPTTFVNPYVVSYRVTDSAGSFTDTTLTIYVYDPPSVTTSAATAVTANTATLNGSANNVVIASPITRYFRYDTTSPGVCNDTFGTQVGGSVGVGAYSENITGLSPSTQYFFCAIATSTGGTTVGALLNFTTAGPANYRSRQSGQWNDFNTWEIDTGGGFVPAVSGQIPSSADGTITIRTGHTVTIQSFAPTVDQTNIEAGGTVSLFTGQLTASDGAGADLVNNGAITSLAAQLHISGQFVNDGTVAMNTQLTLLDGGTATGSGSWTWDPAAQLHFQNTSGPFVVDSADTFWPAVNGPQDIRVYGVGGLQMGVPRTITFISIAAALTGAENLTISDLTSIEPGGSVTGSPTYGAGSSLAYNIGDVYGRGDEWLPGATSGPGVPHNVGVGGNTTLSLPNGITDQEFLMTGDLNVGPGGKLTMAGVAPLMDQPSNDKGREAELGTGTGMTEALRVLGDVTLSGGELELSTADLGDLYVGGDWNNILGTLTNNTRLVAFNGSGTQAINGTTDFGHLAISTTTARTVTFEAGATNAVHGSLTLTGTAGNLLTLRSTSPGTQWNFSQGTPNQDVNFVDVQDSNANFGLTINATNSVNSGNNLNWNFVVVNPGVFSFDPASYSPGEADGTATITVKRNGGTTGTVQVNYSATAGSPAATGGASCAFGSGVDYVTPGGTLTFIDGDDTETFPVTICNDELFEGTEQFNVTLSNPTGGATIGTGTAPVNILDNDVQPSLQFTASNFNVNENGGTATVTVSRTGAVEHQLTVNYAALVGGLTNPATPGNCGAFTGADFVATSGTLTFVPNDASESFPITICNDNLFEANNETIAIALNTQSVPAVLGNPNEGTVTIVPNNDPPTVQFSVAAANAPEETTPYVATVTRTGATENSFSVNFATGGGTASAASCGSGGDYTSTSGTLNFLGGETSLPINVAICDDAVYEGGQTFTVTLSGVTGVGVIGSTNPQTITIVDNDSSPTLTINDLGIVEGNSGFSFLTLTVSKTGATELVTTVNFQSSDLTATSSVAGVCGDNGIDYVGGSGGLTFQPNETSMPITLMICGDVEVEPNETYAVTLSGALNATIADGNGIGTIINDDTAPGTLVVTKTADTNDGACDADCSLREAIAAANDGDTITYSALFNLPQTIVLGDVQINIDKSVTILGPGADKLTIDGAGSSRVFFIPANETISLSGIKIEGGNAGSNNGGGIYIGSSNVNIDGLWVTGNTVTGGASGAGIYSDGAVTITDSTISGNTGQNNGGGIWNFGGTMTLTNTTVSGNTGGAASKGGGIYSQSGILNLNSTTVTLNSAGIGSGVNNETGTANVKNSIVAGNVNNAVSPDVNGTFVSGGFNIIGNGIGSTGFVNGVNGDQVGPIVPPFAPEGIPVPIDPMLDPLADNGGQTLTHKPQNNGPGHDKGCAFGETFDQRGNQRTIDWSNITNAVCADPSENGTDIGAFELLVPTAVPATLGGRIMSASGRGIINVRVTVHNMQGDLVASANTGTFGYYKLHGLTTGASYIVTVRAKRFVFGKPSRVISLDDNIEDFDFVADP